MLKLHLFVIHAKSLTNRLKNVEQFVDQVKRIASCDVTLVGMHDSIEGADVKPEEMLQPQHVSCALKHRQALRDIAQIDDPETLFMVVEDDVVIENVAGFTSILEQFQNQPWDAVFFAPGTADTIVTRPNTYVLQTCHAYVVRPAVAAELAKAAEPIRFRWPIHLTLGIGRFNCGLAGCISDGSKFGRFISTQATGITLFHPKFTEFVTALRQDTDVEAAYQKVFDSDIIADHPVINSAYASYLSAKRRHREAHVVLQRAMDVAVKHPGVILNRNSEFMQQFLQSFVHVQE